MYTPSLAALALQGMGCALPGAEPHGMGFPFDRLYTGKAIAPRRLIPASRPPGEGTIAGDRTH